MSNEFPFGPLHNDEHLKFLLQPCYPRCTRCGQHDRGRILAYHPGCLAFTSRPSNTFLHATEYSFEPDAFEEERRRRWILTLLSERMSKTHPRLPAELRLLVAQHLVRECAIAASQQAWHARCSRDCDVDISLGIWVDYVYIDGIRYISHLSSHAGPSSTARQLVHAGAPRATALYVLEDHLGIRELVFSEKEEYRPTPRPRSGLRWRTVPLTSERVKMKSDVSLASQEGAYINRSKRVSNSAMSVPPWVSPRCHGVYPWHLLCYEAFACCLLPLIVISNWTRSRCCPWISMLLM